jgi:hypothetical protein
MPKEMLSGRVDVELVRWVTGYAIERGVSRTAVIEWALREARGLARAGVPDLAEPPADGRSARVGRVRRAGARASSSSGRASAVSRPAAGAPASLADVVTGTGPVQAAAPARAVVIPLVNVVAMRQRLPRALARRDVAMGLVRVGGAVCRDADAVVDPSEVEC